MPATYLPCLKCHPSMGALQVPPKHGKHWHVLSSGFAGLQHDLLNALLPGFQSLSILGGTTWCHGKPLALPRCNQLCGQILSSGCFWCARLMGTQGDISGRRASASPKSLVQLLLGLWLGVSEGGPGLLDPGLSASELDACPTALSAIEAACGDEGDRRCIVLAAAGTPRTGWDCSSLHLPWMPWLCLFLLSLLQISPLPALNQYPRDERATAARLRDTPDGKALGQ